MLLDLAVTWDVPAKYGDISNAYAKVKKESRLEILLQVPQATEVNEATVKELGATSKKELTLKLRKSLYVLKHFGRQFLHAK